MTKNKLLINNIWSFCLRKMAEGGSSGISMSRMIFGVFVVVATSVFIILYETRIIFKKYDNENATIQS